MKVHGIELADDNVPLRSMVSAVELGSKVTKPSGVLVASNSDESVRIVASISKHLPYRAHFVANPSTANVLRVNDSLLVSSELETFDSNRLTTITGLQLRPVNMYRIALSLEQFCLNLYKFVFS